MTIQAMGQRGLCAVDVVVVIGKYAVGVELVFGIVSVDGCYGANCIVYIHFQWRS